jgi:hypothetical protein
MKPQDITITIDELVLDGLDGDSGQRVAEALSQELKRSFVERGLPAGLRSQAGARMTTAAPAAGVPETAEGVGTRVAQALYRSWTPPTKQGDRR